MIISLILFTGCSLNRWISIPSTFTVCDVDISYTLDTKYDRHIIGKIGWCTPAKFLQKKNNYKKTLKDCSNDTY